MIFAVFDPSPLSACKPQFLGDPLYKSSAVAEMGDRLATVNMGRKEGGYSAPVRGSWIPI